MKGRNPALSPAGWTFGRGSLPFPRDRERLWSVIADIIDNHDRNTLVLSHHNADLDAVATSLILKWTFPWIKIGAFKSVSQAGKKLLSYFGEDIEIDPSLDDVSLLIVVDSSSPMQVIEGSMPEHISLHVLDHHPDHSHWGDGVYVDSDMGACAEIALQIAMLTNSPLTDDTALAALAGIIADTGKYRFANPVDLDITSFLISGSDVCMEDVMIVIEGEEYFDVSKKIAQLKAMRRLRYLKTGEQVIAASRVNSFEAAACRVLLVAGADVAFVAADKKDEVRVSARAKPHVIRAGIHLGHFMEDIGRKTGNQGGGHDGAAGLNGSGNADDILMLCLDEMDDLLREKFDLPSRDGNRRKGRGRSRKGRSSGKRNSADPMQHIME